MIFISNLPFSVEAAAPSQYSSSLVTDALTEINFFDNYSFDSLYPTVSSVRTVPSVTATASTSKKSVIKLPTKTKLIKNTKSGVSISVPAKPTYALLTSKPVSDSVPQFGYLQEIGFKNSETATALVLVSSGIFSSLGWDSMQYGAESTMRDIFATRNTKLPPAVLKQLVPKKESILINGHVVTHNFIEYQGVRLFGMYAASKKYDQVFLGIMTVYAHPSLLSVELQKEILDDVQAQQLLITALSKSQVNQKQAKQYFKIK